WPPSSHSLGGETIVNTATLGAQHVKEYQEQGYAVVDEVFSPSELQEIDNEIDRLLEQKNEARNEGWIMALGLRSDITRNFAQDERILHLIEEIVRPGIAIH